MKKILIVDDDRDLLNLLQHFLEQHSFEAQTIAKASEVFPAIESFKPNLILMDIHLEGFDGRDICKEIKSHQKTRKIPVVIVSADTAKQDQLKAAGADDFIEKPLDTDLLLKTIHLQIQASELFA